MGCFASHEGSGNIPTTFLDYAATSAVSRFSNVEPNAINASGWAEVYKHSQMSTFDVS